MYRNLLWRCTVSVLATIFLAAPLMAGAFVGSDKCQGCHKAIYDTWKESSHAKAFMALTPDNDWVIADWQGEVRLKSGNIPEAVIRLSKDGEGNYFATLTDSKDPSREMTYKVEATQGSGTVKGQQYYVRIGNYYYTLPMNWQTIASRFIPASLDIWYNEDGSLKQPSPDKSWEMDCAGCHQTGLEYRKTADGYETTCSEMSIGCEKCHGAGSEHIAAAGAENTIINPRDLEYERGMDVCNQCHDTQGRSVPEGTIRGAWNEEKGHGYAIGEPLSDYMQSSGGPGSPVLAPLSGRDIYHMLGNSRHFEAETTCFDCHDPHGGPAFSNLKRADFNNNLCLRCHGEEKAFSTPTMIMQHTQHSYDPDMKGTSRCTNCHQIQARRIKAPTTGDGMPGPFPGIMAGFLEVVTPIQSMEMFKRNPDVSSSNSCNKCHEEWGGDEAGYRKGAAAFVSKFGSE
jgi:predicted CXXCH cytochrome family protein